MGQKRQKAYRAGIIAERIAALFLMAKGYRVLAFRYKTTAGEIDLIASNAKRIAFVEVKARSGVSRENILFTVTPRQQLRIKRAGDLWLTRNKVSRTKEIGFDIITITPWSLPRHYKDAFSHNSY